MKRLILIILVISLKIISVNAQCNFEPLLDSLLTEIQDNEVLLDDFAVYLHRSDTSKALPMSRFPMEFEKETKYRLRVKYDQVNSESCAILQVIEGGVLKGSNYMVKKRICFESFDFDNPFNRDGEVVIYFVDGLDGCAVATISKVIDKQ